MTLSTICPLLLATPFATSLFELAVQLFPQIARWKESDRGKAFIRRCRLVGISGVCLHSYRYAWAERARTCGYPERFAQEALGHNSVAVHRAYAKKAHVVIPTLEEYEKKMTAADNVILPMPAAA